MKPPKVSLTCTYLKYSNNTKNYFLEFLCSENKSNLSISLNIREVKEITAENGNRIKK
jgi:hypothetical protein